jgi:hypothetical protein
MRNRACLVLIAALSPVSLFAGVTMVTQTTLPRVGCDFRVDKCNTWVTEDPSYFHFRDGISIPGPANVGSANGDPTLYRASFGFRDYAPLHLETVEDLLTLIRAKLSNCPQVELSFDEDTGDITVHYLRTNCDCDCDWSVNVRDVKAGDFVWTRTTDNYSPRLGQMERRKFHTASQQDAQDIQSAFAQICAINNWTISAP